jgi:hypothetical protein
MFKNLKKKGYYFVADALIGSTIIFLSLMVIINGGVKPLKIQYDYEIAEEYSEFMLTTKIEDLSNPYVDQLLNSYINDTSLTIMEQINLFYYNNDTTHAREMIHNLTESLIPEKYSFSYNIINGTAPNTTTTNIYNRTIINIEDADVVIVSRKITFLQIDSKIMFGPAMTEIKLWI